MTKSASAERISDGSNPFAFDVAFLEELSKILGLSETAKQSIEERRFSSRLLSTIDKEDLEKVFPLDDALKIYTWSVVKAQEEEKEAHRVAQEEDKEAQRVARESKLLRAKSVQIYCSTRKAFTIHTILGQREFQKLLTDGRSSGLVSVLCDDAGVVEVLSSVDQLVNGTRYHWNEISMSELDKLRQDLTDSDKAKADYNTASLLSDHFGGKKFEFLGNCVDLTHPVTKNSLGDIDTLLLSNNGSIVALVERKGSLSNKSVDELLSQVKKTKSAFDLCAQHRDPKLISCFGGNFDFSHADIISVVYCKAGPSEVFLRLQREGIFVVKDGVELVAPWRVHET